MNVLWCGLKQMRAWIGQLFPTQWYICFVPKKVSGKLGIYSFMWNKVSFLSQSAHGYDQLYFVWAHLITCSVFDLSHSVVQLRFLRFCRWTWSSAEKDLHKMGEQASNKGKDLLSAFTFPNCTLNADCCSPSCPHMPTIPHSLLPTRYCAFMQQM